MALNLNKLLKVANILDKSGNYELSDKIDHLIKVSQNLISNMPSDYQSTGQVDTGNKLLNSLFSNMSDSAAGSAIFAKGKMFDRFSPFESKFGPSGPAVLTTFTPAQYAKLLQTEEGKRFIAQQQLGSGLKALQFMNQSNVGLASLGKFISQQLAPGVEKTRKQEFLNNILPNTISEQVSRVLQAFPINQWDSRLKEFSEIANQVPEYSNQIKNLINKSVKSGLDKMKYGDEKTYQKMVADPKFQDFSNKFV